MTPCPDETTILAFGRGEGDLATRAMVEQHITECDECRSLVGAVLRSSGMMRAIMVPSGAVDVIAPTTPVLPGTETAAASPVIAPVKAGDVLAGKYLVERVLGAGGMGVVVAARHLQLEQRFALKFLLPEACKAPDAVARFLREGKAAARITSEHVARVVDTGVLENGSPYLVLEYLEGADLGANRAPLSVEDAVEYVLQACEAIVEAHALGIIHRDLKPANLFLARRKDGSPLVKVLDFGISKAIDESGASRDLTSSATMMGSPRYMSPEQMISAKDVDVRTDVWALGVILYELVSGEPVWNADTVQGLCAMIATTPTPSLRALVPSAPELLDDVIQRCLAKSPAQRVPTVADLAMLLAPLASAPAQTSIDRILRVAGRSRSVPIPRPPLVHDAARPRVASNASMPALSQTPATPRRPVSLPASAATGRALFGLGAVIAVVAVVAAGMLYLNRRDAAPAPPAPAAASLPVATPPPPPPTPSTTIVQAAPSASASASPSAAPPKRVKYMKASSTSTTTAAEAPPAPPPAPAPAPAPDPDRAMTDRK